MEGTTIISEQIVERMRQLRINDSKLSTLTEAFSILKDLEEVELAEALKKRGKIIGEKLKRYGTHTNRAD